MAHTGKLAASALAAMGAGFVLMQFTNTAETKDMPEEVKRSPLKKTLSNAGLYPEPGKKGLKRTESGSMAAFTAGGNATDVVLSKGGGDAM